MATFWGSDSWPISSLTRVAIGAVESTQGHDVAADAVAAVPLAASSVDVASSTAAPRDIRPGRGQRCDRPTLAPFICEREFSDLAKAVHCRLTPQKLAGHMDANTAFAMLHCKGGWFG